MTLLVRGQRHEGRGWPYDNRGKDCTDASVSRDNTRDCLQVVKPQKRQERILFILYREIESKQARAGAEGGRTGTSRLHSEQGA